MKIKKRLDEGGQRSNENKELKEASSGSGNGDHGTTDPVGETSKTPDEGATSTQEKN